MLSKRDQRLLNLSKREKTPLMLAATMALGNRVQPQDKIKERSGFVTATVVPDCFKDKCKKSRGDMTIIKNGIRVPKPDNEYSVPKAHKFREEKEIEPGMKDFELRFKPDPMENPNGLSVFEQRPKYQVEKEKSAFERQDAMEKFMAAGKPHDWLKYHTLPEKLIPISRDFGDPYNPKGKPEASEFL